ANMAPEYGATIGLFPVDAETLRYYRLTGRSEAQVELIERYMKEQGMFYTPQSHVPEFNDMLELDLSTVEACVAGPKRPQDRVVLANVQNDFRKGLTAPVKDRGFGLAEADVLTSINLPQEEVPTSLKHGSVVIAAITSCTNTSNPSVLIAAGLLAKKAVERGLMVKDYVKTSFAPGSQVVEEYMKTSGLLTPLEKLGFNIVGYGCTTCIGNSGPLPEKVAKAIELGNLVSAAVLSGNRNFEGRVNPHVKANYLASPPLVVAYALAGTVDVNLETDPLGYDPDGKPVYLKDLWPTQMEIADLIVKNVTAEAFIKRYKTVMQGNENWNAITEVLSDLYAWNLDSTYIQEPPFFDG
ncbi:MAG: aconitase family protein, partial [Sideroxyarcus sp.]|nr:aconitase family protein [Sideroxyarcus sp.]